MKIGMKSNTIENKVAKSGLINIDLANFYPKGERVLFDIKPLLWQEFVLKEKDFRQFIKENDWSVYQSKFVAVYNTADAIVPSWAYMLIVTALEPFAKKVVYGDLEALETVIFIDSLKLNLSPRDYTNKMVIIKGCGDLPITNAAYLEAVILLKPHVKNLMFGEACSSVPVYKAPKK
jgi:hypothetical protein